MDHRSDQVEFVRSVGSPLADEDISQKNVFPAPAAAAAAAALVVAAVDTTNNNDNGDNEDDDDDDNDNEDEDDDGGVGGDKRGEEEEEVVEEAAAAGGEGGGGEEEGVGGGEENGGDSVLAVDNGDDEGDLPQCKIKRNYSCNLCPFFSQNPRSFLYHSRDVHFDRIKIFECSQCLYASKHSQKLQRHINMIHVAGKNRIKRTSKSLKLEKKKDLRAIKPKPGNSPADSSPRKSPKGDGDFEDPGENVHKPEMEMEDVFEVDSESFVGGEFKCSICNFKSKNEKLMRRHEKLVHLKKRFLRCNKCSYVTHVKARYTKHVKYHSMPMIKCDLCDFRTPYKWNLDRHYKNHCGSGAFQCSKCNFRADIKQSLTVHEMNHHVPPVGQGAIMARKKNKAKLSEPLHLHSNSVDNEDLELLRMEREDSEPGNTDSRDLSKEEKMDEVTFQNIRNVKVPYTNKRESANNNNLQTDFIHPDDIVPRYGQIYVKNLKCKFCSYKAVFSHEIWRHEKRIHGYIRPEMKNENVPKRPPPKLIPIQNKCSPGGVIPSPILKIPAVKNKTSVSVPVPVPVSVSAHVDSSPGDKSVNENEFNEMCKKSCLTSSLKDFVSLIGDEEGLKTIPDSSQEDLDADNWTGVVEDSDSKMDTLVKQKQTDLLKKKNASFFDKLKEKLMTGNSEEQSLFCETCGHESKCLSEAVAHQKRHSDSSFRTESDGQQENEIVLSGTELSSTRCQHCRHRCKTSTDLINHLKSCKAFGAVHDNQTNMDELENKIKVEESSYCADDKGEEEGNLMENRVFVWNDLRQGQEEEEEDRGGDTMDADIHSNDEYQLDGPPVYGTVTSKGSDNTESGILIMEIDPRLNLTVKKVFKCPHCSFWASTASRFHVHIVGHLNKKPFECSLCLYRSNWRWDITKHIRLKSARDPSHLEAKVNMTDETGRRNYSKYNKYLTMMKVQESTAESSGTGRRSKPNEATQGNVTERDIIPLPAPPRLTRAPTPGTPHQVPQGIPLRPPPPLKAAHPMSCQTKVHPNAAKGSKEGAKKTLWKCKKCNFRDSNKTNVLAHVKEHYEKKNEGPKRCKNSESGDNTEEGEDISAEVAASYNMPAKPLKTPTYKCGHCQQVSNWKHVIQRHCRLKHNGNALIQVGWKEGPAKPVQRTHSGENSENFEPAENSVELISCDICPFTTDTEGDLTAHKLNHVDRPGSIFKCSYCPFYVPSKIAVLEHMEIHGVNDGCDLTSLKVDNFDPSECNQDFSTENDGSSGDLLKRYKCRQCPYLSNNRTQFLYHKQFHRPRNAPFKCMYCSYNVSRRHLLHQHLRVHHSQNEASQEASEVAPRGPSEPVSGSTDLKTLHMPEIPLVWVFKSGNFQKMFKCRWCPHVNMRKINIQEHEKMHQANERTRNGTTEGSQQLVKLHCPECNYTCNNAGVLASHVKVHQGFYGEIRCLVDPTKPEADQIRELESRSRIIEPEIVIKEEALDGENVRSEGVEDEPLSSQPENAYNQSSNSEGTSEETKKILSFCNKCPARFFFKKELRIHSKFHLIHLPFRCAYCTYTARQRPHLLAHYKVHSEEYQERTTGLVGIYAVSPDHPQPKTRLLKKDGQCETPIWTVSAPADDTAKKEVKTTANGPGQVKPTPKHACHRCPARFFKSVALQYHLTLHGGTHKHKCKYCDYTVKTYGNLIKHQLVHEEESKKKSPRPLKFSYEFPISVEDVLRGQTEELRSHSEEELVVRRADPQFGALMYGSPEFIYPTYLKNGKIKEKKYKCHKCPSAFEKREQYRIHVALHGSKQKHKCEKCDYSVKYYANYVQHMKKHQSHDEALRARNSKPKVLAPLEFNEKFLPSAETIEPEIETREFEKKPKIIGERKKSQDLIEDKKLYDCMYCPYASNRRDAADSHLRRHYRVSKLKFEFECPHCDYSTSQKNFLREHSKLHFNTYCRYKAEAYLKCEKMELWYSENNAEGGQSSDVLIFQDRGEDAETRFFPAVAESETEKDMTKVYVNLTTAERLTEDRTGSGSSEPEANDDVERVPNSATSCQIQIDGSLGKGSSKEEKGKTKREKGRPKFRRWRGKNWKCKKCPHAFGKRDQYIRHIGLHGSNQKHNCDICDYSVKFYTNYVQHMRMHQMHDPERPILVKKNCQSSDEDGGGKHEEQTPTECDGWTKIPENLQGGIGI